MCTCVRHMCMYCVCMCVSSVHECLEIDNKGHTLKLKQEIMISN